MNRRIRTAAAALAAALTVLAAVPGTASAAPGDPDPAFGTAGRSVLNVGASGGTLGDVAVQPDGKIVAVGHVVTGIGPDALVVRLRPDGSPDPTFGDLGAVKLNNGFGEVGEAVALQPDGKILVAGHLTSTTVDAALWRLNPDGSRDTGFGDQGLVSLDYKVDEGLAGVAVQGDGKIVAVGRIGTSSRSGMAAFRFTAQGKPDPAFGGGGGGLTQIPSSSGYSAASTLDLQRDGKILVGGYNGDRQALTVYRLTTAGTLDPDFGEGKSGLVFVPGTGPIAFDVRAMPDGTVVALGHHVVKGTAEPYLARFSSSGGLDPSYGGGVPLPTTVLHSLALDRAGRVVASGGVGTFGTQGSGGVVTRFNAAGHLDTGFGRGGVTLTASEPGSFGIGTAVQPNGAVVTVGNDGGTPLNPMVVRVTGDPAPGSPPPPPPPASVPACQGRPATVVGTPGDDRLAGTPGADVIVGLDGDDKISARGGNDLVCAGDGDDKVVGGGGKDVLRGEAGDDRLAGGSGRDRLVGGPGRDRVRQ